MTGFRRFFLVTGAVIWTAGSHAQTTTTFTSIMTPQRSTFDRIVSVGTGGSGTTYQVTNTAVGYQPLWENTTGRYNTAFGHYALWVNTVGRVNTALGAQALFRNTEGNYNLAIGVESLANNVTGVNNTAVGGYDTMLMNTTGSSNTALGYAALYSNTVADGNTAIGQDALYSNTIGALNTAVGRQAGEENVSGSLNTFVGFNAGKGNLEGSGNTYVGTYAGLDHTGSYNIFIGASATGRSLAADNQLSIGNIIFGDLVTGTVLIGTAIDNGVDRLQVGGSVQAERFRVSQMDTPPETSSSACGTGEIRYTEKHIYVCIAPDTWRRAALEPF